MGEKIGRILLQFIAHSYINTLYYLLVARYKTRFRVFTFLICLLPSFYVKLYFIIYLSFSSACLLVYVVSLLYDSFGGQIARFLKFAATPEYFALYGNPGSVMAAAAKLAQFASGKQQAAAAVTTGGKTLAGGAIVGLGFDHVVKTFCIDQVGSHAIKETYNSLTVPGYARQPLDSGIGPNSSLLEKIVSSSAVTNAVMDK